MDYTTQFSVPSCCLCMFALLLLLSRLVCTWKFNGFRKVCNFGCKFAEESEMNLMSRIISFHGFLMCFSGHSHLLVIYAGLFIWISLPFSWMNRTLLCSVSVTMWCWGMEDYIWIEHSGIVVKFYVHYVIQLAFVVLLAIVTETVLLNILWLFQSSSVHFSW